MIFFFVNSLFKKGLSNRVYFLVKKSFYFSFLWKIDGKKIIKRDNGKSLNIYIIIFFSMLYYKVLIKKILLGDLISVVF